MPFRRTLVLEENLEIEDNPEKVPKKLETGRNYSFKTSGHNEYDLDRKGKTLLFRRRVIGENPGVEFVGVIQIIAYKQKRRNGNPVTKGRYTLISLA